MKAAGYNLWKAVLKVCFERYGLKRLLALLIIPLVAVGNSFPHTHASVDAGSDHAERPHVHVASLHHAHDGHDHHHRHRDGNVEESQKPTPARLPDHDSDAIYLSGGQFFLPVSGDNPGETQLNCVGFVASDLRLDGKGWRADSLGYEVPIRTGPALFLLHAALRL